MFETSFDGISLRCCTLIQPPIVFADPNHVYGFNGIAIEYLENLQRKLNFSCSSIQLFPNDNNTGFNDFISDMERCTTDGRIRQDPTCKCDIGTAAFNLNPLRLGRVDFLPPFLNDDIRVVTHVDNTAARLDGAFFLTSFSAGVWLGIASLVLIFVLLKLFDASFAPVPRKNTPPTHPNASRRMRVAYFLLKNGILFRVRKALESTLQRMISIPPDKVQGDTRSFRQRLLNYIILLCGLFLILIYEATMTASLVQETSSSEFRSVDDFRTCRIPASDVCIPKGGGIEAFWRFRVASSPCNKESGLFPTTFNNVNEMLQETASRECVYSVGTGGVLTVATQGRYCGILVSTGRNFQESGGRFILPSESPYTPKLTNATLQLQSEGSLPTLTEYSERSGRCSFLIEPRLTFRRLRLFFFLAYGICFLVFLGITIFPQNIVFETDPTNSFNEETSSRVGENLP